MDLFVIPVAGDRYELYCEPSAGVEADDEPAGRGLVAGLRRRFALMLRAAESRERGERVVLEEPAGWLGALQDRIMGWVAERIAEQRLLWRLRHETAVTVVHPGDLDFDQAMVVVRRGLQRDLGRHRRWLVIDGLLCAVSGLLAPLPGPNMVAYFFAFRMVGHWFSLRGASQGLRRTLWNGRPSPELVDLRHAAGLPPAERGERLRDIADRLCLPSLPTFFARIDAGRA